MKKLINLFLIVFVLFAFSGTSMMKEVGISPSYFNMRDSGKPYSITIDSEDYLEATSSYLGPWTLITLPEGADGGAVGHAFVLQKTVPDSHPVEDSFTIKIHLLPNDASMGNVKFVFAYRKCSVGDAYSPSALYHGSTIIEIATVQYEKFIAEYTFTNANVGSGDSLVVVIGRDSEDATDTYAADIHVSDVDMIFKGEK